MNINCFYFSKFSYTLVPWQIKEDLQRIKDTGANSITLNIIEQDYKAARENIELVIEEARKLGLKIYFIPERWLGVFGGVHDFPSVWTLKNMQYSITKATTDYLMTATGPVSSLFVPETISFLKKKLKECFKYFGFDGMIWYQPNLYWDAAGGRGGMDITANAYTAVFSALNKHVKSTYDAPEIGWLPHPNSEIQLRAEKIEALDKYDHQIVLLDHRGYIAQQTKDLETKIDTILAKKSELFCYFDYPVNVALPEQSMKIIKKALSEKKH